MPSSSTIRNFVSGPIPVFTYATIAACVVAFVASLAMPELTSMMAVSAPAVMSGRVYTLFTAMFAHGGIMHITMNMCMLFYLGTALERLYGTFKTALVYLASGIFSNVSYVAINMALGSSSSAVGASGAIFGLIGMFAVLLLKEMKVQRMLAVKPTWQSSSGFFSCLGVNILMSFVPGVAWEAHFGGLLAGLVLGLAVYLWASRKFPAQDRG